MDVYSAIIITVSVLYPDVLNGDVPIFEGKPQYTWYDMRLTKLVKQLDRQLKILGSEAGDLGSHSCHKGWATMAAAGYTVSSPIVLICMRAWWVSGGVKDKYLLSEKYGDQYVGSCSSFLDQLKK